MPTHFYDEMYADTAKTSVRAHYAALNDWMSRQTAELIAEKRQQADLMFRACFRSPNGVRWKKVCASGCRR